MKKKLASITGLAMLVSVGLLIVVGTAVAEIGTHAKRVSEMNKKLLIFTSIY